MIRRVNIIILVILLFAAVQIGWGETPAGRENLFILGAGARALGMGGAFTAVCDDGAAAYYNPAGLALLQYRELTLFNTNLFENTKYQFGGFVYPWLGFGTVAMAGIRIGTDDVVFRDRLGQLGTHDYSLGQYWLSYGVSIRSNLAVGVSFKYLSQALGDMTTSTGSCDVGLLANFRKTVFMGLTAQDILAGELKLGSKGERIPYNIKAGLALKIALSDWGVIMAADGDKGEGIKMRFHYGSELNLKQTIFLRGGFDRSEFTLGMGLKYKLAAFDYAYKSHSELNGTHRLGLSLFFGPTVTEQKARRQEKQKLEEKRHSEENRRNQIDLLSSKADRFFKARTWDSAAFYYNQVLAYDPENMVTLARLREISGQVDSITNTEIDTRAGQMAFDRLLEKYLRNADSLYLLGSYENAQEEYALALQLDSSNQMALEGLGKIENIFEQRFADFVAKGDSLLQQEKHAEAIMAFTEAQKFKPGDRSLQDKIAFGKTRLLIAQKLKSAMEQLNRGDTARAKELFLQVLQADPGEKVAHEYLARLEAIQKAVPVSIEQLKADHEIWNIYLEGLKYFGDGNYQKAIEKWEIVLEKYPGSEDTLENLQQARARLKNESH